MEFREVRCQEKMCPYGKQPNQRCLLGEVCSEDLSGIKVIRERLKCPKATKGKLQYIIVVLKAA